MKTKVILLAVLVVASAGKLAAQSNVYSLNVVGFKKVAVPANGYALVANQFNTTNNAIKNVIASPPPGTLFYKYNNGYSVYTFDGDDLVWTPNGDVTLSPGEGGFMRNFGGTPLTITFAGEVLQGSLTNPVPQGFTLLSAKVPLSGGISDLGYVPAPGDQLFKYSGGYSVFTFDADDLVWTPTQPPVGVGESFFIRRFAPGTNNWVINFTVPP